MFQAVNGGPSQTVGRSTRESSIIVPARNEEASLADCLQSLVAQTGVNCEIIVVDDGSTDRTREIAESFAVVQSNARVSVRVISPDRCRRGGRARTTRLWPERHGRGGRGCCSPMRTPCICRGRWRGRWRRRQQREADLLSYSPEQVVGTFCGVAVLPVVSSPSWRAEYPPERSSRPASPIVAANGQYILVRREAYDYGRRTSSRSRDKFWKTLRWRGP